MTTPPDLIICVDNGSAPEYLAELRAGMPPGTVLIENGENLGVAAANNIGMAHAISNDVDWTLFLNNDAIVTPECLQRCLDEATSDDRIAIVGPAVTFADRPDVLWLAGGKFSEWFAYTRHRALSQPVEELPPTADVGYMPTCCALVSTRAWQQIGPVREDYFMYYEDTEWCQRARVAGWTVRYLGEILCTHAVSASGGTRGSLGLTENMAYYLARNPLRFAIETSSAVRRVSRIVGLLTIWAGFNTWRVVQSRSPSIGRAYLLGLLDAVRGRMGKRPGAA
jgi:hypothetical protein